MHWDAKKIFQILRFSDTYIDKPKFKKLNNAQLLRELPFYDKLKLFKIRQHLVVMFKVIKLKLWTKEM